jgi:hypothetical protein
MKLEFSGQIFAKSPNVTFKENSFGGGRFIPCGRTKVNSLFEIFAIAPKNLSSYSKKVKVKSVCGSFSTYA